MHDAIAVPTLADEIAAVRAMIADMLLVKAINRTPKYERTIEAMHAVLRRLIAIAEGGNNS
jgi:hypothetical protein